MNIRLYIANLGAYNRGYLVGQWINLPTDEGSIDDAIEDVLNGEEAIQSRDYLGYPDEEIAIHDYESDYIPISETTNIRELNDLLLDIEGFPEEDIDKIKAVMTAGIEVELKELVSDIDSYRLITEVENYEDLGRYYLGDSAIDESLTHYFDYERYGRDMTINIVGEMTRFGYVYKE